MRILRPSSAAAVGSPREEEETPAATTDRPSGFDDGVLGEESDVFVAKRDPDPMAGDADEVPSAESCVTLFVTGWHSVEPGPLSWAFPSMRSALEAVRKMKNAIEWAIAQGDQHVSLDDARAKGAILIEQRA